MLSAPILGLAWAHGTGTSHSNTKTRIMCMHELVSHVQNAQHSIPCLHTPQASDAMHAHHP